MLEGFVGFCLDVNCSDAFLSGSPNQASVRSQEEIASGLLGGGYLEGVGLVDVAPQDYGPGLYEALGGDGQDSEGAEPDHLGRLRGEVPQGGLELLFGQRTSLAVSVDDSEGLSDVPYGE